jgi:hypothetical protein
MGAAGDMKESHHIGLQVVGRRVKSDGTRSKELEVEHLEHLKSTRLRGEDGSMVGNAL